MSAYNITLGGITRHMKFDHSAALQLDRQLGRSVYAFWEDGTVDPASLLNRDFIATSLWASLLHESKGETVEQVNELIPLDPQGFGAIAKTVIEAMTDSWKLNDHGTEGEAQAPTPTSE